MCNTVDYRPEKLIDSFQNPQSILADLASMLLSNLTASSLACSVVLSLKISIIPVPILPNSFHATQSRCGTSLAPDPYPSGESREVLALPLLLEAFAQGAQPNESGDLSKRTRKGELHFLASVFANISVVGSYYSFKYFQRVDESYPGTSRSNLLPYTTASQFSETG